MRRVFADSFFFFALFNRNDAAHRKAVELSQQRGVQLVTTAWVLTELADGLACSTARQAVRRFVLNFQLPGQHVVLPATAALWHEGIDLYDRRKDKQWSLTDCISMVAMTEQGITDVLTGDHHFVQAGFKALFI
ncbi:MAG TPA: PIN domain-containing protein [Pirellulales bacterium]|jgi:predicted nucleic acid-binding protein|nr:PIN domain-containing protein [Pirellulales bacterium]